MIQTKRSPPQRSAQQLERLVGVARADLSFEVGDGDPRMARNRAAPRRREPLVWRAPADDFSGLPGVTSHQTRSSLSLLSASSEISRWPSCGGLNEPPSSPIVCRAP